MKYIELGSPIMDAHIDGIIVPNTLIDLGDEINVMNKETTLSINSQGVLRKNITVLQLINRSTVAP